MNKTVRLFRYQVLKYGPSYSNIVLDIPPYIQKPNYNNIKPIQCMNSIHVNNATEIQSIRKACNIARLVLEFATAIAREGITTEELDYKVHKEIIKYGAYPSPLMYLGFPKSICTSVNNVICHGIPDNRKLQDGDILNCDVTVFYKGYHGDTSKTICIGDVDDEGRDLVEKTRMALDVGIQQVRPGAEFHEIGTAIEKFADKHLLNVERTFCGHGIGSQFHQEPLILHYENSEPGTMLPGMVFTIEPILCLGSTRSVKWSDGWTVSSLDGSRSAQFEHTVLVTDQGVEILT